MDRMYNKPKNLSVFTNLKYYPQRIFYKRNPVLVYIRTFTCVKSPYLCVEWSSTYLLIYIYIIYTYYIHISLYKFIEACDKYV